MIRNKKMNFITAVLIVAIMALALSVGLLFMELKTVTVFAVVVTIVCIIAFIKGFSIVEIESFFVDGIKKAAPTLAILIAVGALVGTWIAGGIVPTIIYYGLEMINPGLVVFLAFILCCIASLVVGSSYTSAATFGVAFMGIGLGMGVDPALLAGACVSGSIFGDKLSPFSDTTNLAPAVAGTDLFSHIRSMLWTTVPAFAISGVLYLVLGLKYSKESGSVEQLELIKNTIAENFNIQPLLMLIPIVTILLAIKKVPALTSLVIGTMAGLLAGLVFQGDHVTVSEMFSSIGTGYAGESGVADVDALLNRGGISSMYSILVISMFSLSFGEMLTNMGVLDALMNKMEGFMSSARNLVIGTLLGALITNMLTGSQYMALVIPGELFKKGYQKAGIRPYVLSRTMEDGGTIFTFIVPWAVGALYVSGVLGVSTVEYLPYCFFAILSPIISAIYGLIDFKPAIPRMSEEERLAIAEGRVGEQS